MSEIADSLKSVRMLQQPSHCMWIQFVDSMIVQFLFGSTILKGYEVYIDGIISDPLRRLNVDRSDFVIGACCKQHHSVEK